MALAILEFLGLENGTVTFSVDSGSNRYYQLKVGRSVQKKAGIEWVDEVVFATPVTSNPVGGNLLSTSTEVSLPATRFAKGNVHVQLFTFKTADGKSPAFSRVVTVPMGARFLGLPAAPLAFSRSVHMLATDSFMPARRGIPCRSYSDVYALSTSYEDLLAGFVKLAAPVVMNLLGGVKGQPQKNGASAPAAAGGGSPQANAGAPQADLLATLLNAILGGMSGTASLSLSQSYPGASDVHDNRFLQSQDTRFSQTMFLPLLMPLLTAVAGPLVQILPQLMNSANQRRVQLKQADNNLMTTLLSDVNRRMMVDKLLEMQRQQPAGAQPVNPADLNALIQLLQQPPASSEAAAPVAGAAAPVAGVAATSLSFSAADTSTISSKAVVSFITAAPIAWNGEPTLLFAKKRPLELRIRLSVAEPAPTTALPKAIVKITFKGGSHQSVWLEKTFKQKNVFAAGEIRLPFSVEETAHLPKDQPIHVFAEMRWLTPQSGREYRALGSLDLVLVDKYFLKQIGKANVEERELTDMNHFRPFWNKVWEAPTLHMTSGGQDTAKKYLWELSAAAKYAILLTAEKPTNGLMQTKLLRQTPDPDSLTDLTEGRMKAGIELSIAELNKLLPLWPAHAELDGDRLEALNSEAVARNRSGEFLHSLKLKGRAGQQGMIWIVPIFKLFDVTLQTIQTTDESGQLLAVAEETVQFPFPVSARVIGLKSQQ